MDIKVNQMTVEWNVLQHDLCHSLPPPHPPLHTYTLVHTPTFAPLHTYTLIHTPTFADGVFVQNRLAMLFLVPTLC